MKRLVAHALAIAIGACAGIAAAQLNGGVMESQRQGASAITSGSITGLTTLQVSGTGPHAIGGATSSIRQISYLGAFSGPTGLYVNPQLTGTSNGQVATIEIGNTSSPSANDIAVGLYVTSNLTLNKAGSGTHADFASAIFAPPTIGAGAAALTNATTVKITAAPSVGTNQRALWVAAGTTQLDGQVNAKGSATNDSAAAGYVGELLTTTVASGSAVSLTTATSANIATLSLTAGDWDCGAQVTHNAAATTSVTLLQIGISATTATLPTQAGGSGIGTDPLAIFRQAAAVPGGALTTNVGPVRVTLSGTTNIFLVANDTFTVSTMTGYGTIRCRRMR